MNRKNIDYVNNTAIYSSQKDKSNKELIHLTGNSNLRSGCEIPIG